MQPPRRFCRFCAFTLIVLLSIYLFIGNWVLDSDVQSVFNKVWYINGYRVTSESAEIACYFNATNNKLPELETTVTPDTSIFFVETSCREHPGVQLTPRQACAVESAAKMNPKSDVYVLFPAPIVVSTSALSPSVAQLISYPNVRLRHVNMDMFFRDTPLEQWYLEGQLRTSHWPRSHTSDILRFLTLWKFGGIYLDLDVVVTKYLANLTNFAGAESMEDVAAGVLSFSKGGDGHKMATACVNELRWNFRGYDWGYNGPGVITRVLQHFCATVNVEEMTPMKCSGFTVFPPSMFYAIPWRKWRLYFDTEHSQQTLQQLADSKAIHVWNKFSTEANITVGSNQPYGVIASQYCPKVYSHAGSVF